MTIPSFLFGFIISTLYGLGFHLLRGGGAGRLLLYLFMSWIGFWTGHVIADQLDWSFASVGSLHLGMATVGSLVFLILGHWLSMVEPEKPRK
jgi:uncharacterized membrane protein YeaQ/YmgE (transglycosylase-associated protein family)